MVRLVGFVDRHKLAGGLHFHRCTHHVLAVFLRAARLVIIGNGFGSACNGQLLKANGRQDRRSRLNLKACIASLSRSERWQREQNGNRNGESMKSLYVRLLSALKRGWHLEDLSGTGRAV